MNIVIVNKGGGTADDDAPGAIRQAFAKAGIDADIRESDGAGLADAAAQALAEGARLIVAAGGDGTVSAIAGAVAGSDAALGILPLGTLNHFARDLGIPTDLDAAARVIAAGRIARIDVAEVNGRTFINNSAIGLYPMMVMDRDNQQKRFGRSKRLAMLVASLHTLMNFRRQRLRLEVDGVEHPVATPLLFVGNNGYATGVRSAGKRASLSEGRLSVYALRSASRIGLITATLRALFGHSGPGDLIALPDVRDLVVRSRRHRIEVAMDGEVAAFTPPLHYRIRPGALTVLAP